MAAGGPWKSLSCPLRGSTEEGRDLTRSRIGLAALLGTDCRDTGEVGRPVKYGNNPDEAGGSLDQGGSGGGGEAYSDSGYILKRDWECLLRSICIWIVENEKLKDDLQNFGLNNWKGRFHSLIGHDFRKTNLGRNQLDLGHTKFYTLVMMSCRVTGHKGLSTGERSGLES